MTAAQIAADIAAAQKVSNSILTTIAELDPEAEVPAEAAGVVMNLTGEFLQVAMTAWSNANGKPISIEALQALLPSDEPLDPPTE